MIDLERGVKDAHRMNFNLASGQILFRALFSRTDMSHWGGWARSVDNFTMDVSSVR